jgi:hypothetical protein
MLKKVGEIIYIMKGVGKVTGWEEEFFFFKEMLSRVVWIYHLLSN